MEDSIYIVLHWREHATEPPTKIYLQSLFSARDDWSVFLSVLFPAESMTNRKTLVADWVLLHLSQGCSPRLSCAAPASTFPHWQVRKWVWENGKTAALLGEGSDAAREVPGSSPGPGFPTSAHNHRGALSRRRVALQMRGNTTNNRKRGEHSCQVWSNICSHSCARCWNRKQLDSTACRPLGGVRCAHQESVLEWFLRSRVEPSCWECFRVLDAPVSKWNDKLSSERYKASPEPSNPFEIRAPKEHWQSLSPSIPFHSNNLSSGADRLKIQLLLNTF